MRALLAATLVAALTLIGSGSTAAAATPVSDCLTLSNPTCYSPHQFDVAYGVAPLLAHGVDGRGETVVLPEFAPSGTGTGVTDIRPDLALYDRLFGLPTVRLRIITRLAGAVSPYLSFSEEMGDVEVVHAIAPEATIKVVLIPADVLKSGAAATANAYAQALRLAADLGQVIASTAGWGEQCFTAAEVATVHSALVAAEQRQVTVVVSAGDSGAASGPCPGASTYAPAKGLDYPASDPLVLAVGGTRLQARHTSGDYVGETVWNLPVSPGPVWALASTGGFSGLFPRPAYQADMSPATAERGVPDVAANAAPDTGIAIAATNGQEYAIGPGAGTSASAPFWAAVIAIADQFAGHNLGLVNPAIYRIGNGPAYRGAFHDVIQGNNTVTFSGGPTVTGYPAARGWDPTTGWGSPDAAVLVPLLAAEGGRRSPISAR